MPIQEQNIVFLKSQVMDDVPEGGGAATGNVVADGLMNNVFEDISDLDRAYGRFNLRKLAVGVRTASTDLFGGAKTLITDLPEDEAISYALFSTADPFDRRQDAAGRVEAYLYLGSEMSGYLLENHITGQRSLQIFQRPESQLPAVGETIALQEGAGATEKLQYVRLTRVTAETRIFSYQQSGGYVDYPAVVLTCDISDALRHDFTGSPPDRSFRRATSAVKLRQTVVADAARYYGASRLAAAASVGDYTLRAGDIFSRIVPSSQAESPLVDQPMVGSVQPVVAAADSAITNAHKVGDANVTIGPNRRYNLPSPCWPGSLDIWGLYSDDGQGNVIANGNPVGRINYASGEIQFGASAALNTAPRTDSYIPAAPVSLQAYSLSREVSAATRAYNWVLPLLPLPAPGSLEIAYLSQGNWYALRDNGVGQLAGSAPGHGSGTVSYVTGTASITLGALPDAGSQIVASWGTPREFIALNGENIDSRPPVVRFDLGTGVSWHDFSIKWVSGGIERTAITFVNSGRLYGDAIDGQVSTARGEVWFRPKYLPDPGAEYLVTYREFTRETYMTITGDTVTWNATLPVIPVKAGTVSVRFLRKQITSETGEGLLPPQNLPAILMDDGIGNFREWPTYLEDKPNIPGCYIDYGTGEITLSYNDSHPYDEPAYLEVDDGRGRKRLVFNRNEPVTRFSSIAAGGITVHYMQDGVDSTPQQISIPAPAITLDLAPLRAGTLVPGSIVFRFAYSTFVDRNGTLYRDIDPSTGAGIPSGSIDYSTGIATLTSWPATAADDFELLAGLLAPSSPGRSYVTGRTAARPLKPQSFFLSATTLDGQTITAVAQADGSLQGPQVEGTLDTETGIYEAVFGQWVTDPANPTGPEIWQSTLVDPSSIRYNAVAYSYLPLDAAVLGIDPVRLPADGRVPIYRVGDVAHILHTASTTGTPSLASGKYKLSLGRARIAWVKVLDANGAIIPSGYTLDRVGGVVEFDSLAGLATPLTVRHTISDLRQITDVQITGHLSFARPLTHDYPAGETLVSSCLIHGDRRARVSAVWDQQTWNNTWTDSPQGSEALATLDTIAHPITVTNEGSETERWVLRWTTATNVELIGQTRGLVFSGPFTADIAPINPRTRDSNGTGGVPYLTIPVAANGGGWSAGNVVRINTVGAIAPFWIARAIQQSDIPMDDGADGCEIACIGNIDRP